jgi:RNA polymerase sigma-70 factor (ECF subfamily)
MSGGYLAETEPWQKVACSDNPERALAGREWGELLRKALTLIPEEQRLVILMKEFEGLTFPEIADVLSESENTVKSRMYYGLKALRKVLAKWNITKEAIHYEE